MSDHWTAADLPPQQGRVVLVTGANSGIGLRAAEELAGAGARVLMACRNPDKARAAVDGVRRRFPDSEIETIELDLADLGSVERAAGQVRDRVEALDLLINNAGVMATPQMRTADGFELQLGTNHLGHYALTGDLLETLLAAPAARIVSVSSMAHRQGKMDFDDLNWEHGYSRWPAYGRSKLSNLLFTFELDRQLRRIDSPAIAVAAHPGYSATNLQSAGPGEGTFGVVLKPLFKLANVFFAQSDEKGALPTLYAATAPDVVGGDYIGPDGIGEARGYPTKVGCSSEASDEEAARRLWKASEELTGVRFEALDADEAPAGGQGAG